jgi:hypothetical protein
LLFGSLLEVGFPGHLKWHFGIGSGCELNFILSISHNGYLAIRYSSQTYDWTFK